MEDRERGVAQTVYFCDQCNRVAVRIQDNHMVVYLRHDKEYHRTAVPLADLEALLPHDGDDGTR